MPLIANRYLNAMQRCMVFLLILLLPTQLGLHLWPSWTNIDGLRIDYLSPVISIVSIIALCLIMILWKRNAYDRHVHVSILIIILICVNTVFSLIPQLTLYRWASAGIMSFALYLIVKNHEYDREIFLGLALGTCLQLVLALLQFYSQGAIQGIWYWLGERAVYPWMPDMAQITLHGRQFLRPYGTFSHPNALAGFYLVVHFLLQSGLPMTKMGFSPHLDQKKWDLIPRIFSLLKYCAIVASALLVLISFSRTAIAVFVILHIVLVWRDPTYRWCRFCQVVRPVVMISVGVVFLQGQGDVFTNEKRWYLILRALEVFSSHLITGTGWGASVATTAGNYFQNIPLYQPVHNIYLLWMVETGMIGTAIALYLVHKYWRNLWHGLAVSSPFVALLLTGLNDHYWLTQPQNIALCLFITLWLLHQPKSQIDGKIESGAK
ncbi:MAG: O-antigen ligase family protein [Candidatus Roizmanbacteria bacterium]